MNTEKPSKIIKAHLDAMLPLMPKDSCGIEAVDILARHVAKLAAHADAVDAYLDALLTPRD